jgi:hypothetical protein
MNKIKLFNPEGVKPDDYRHKFPELERTEEFNELSAQALIFVWYYSNPTSELVIGIPDDNERVVEALKKSKYNPSKAERENIVRLQFDTSMAEAIKKMSNFDPGIRFKSYKMIANIFNHYEALIEKGPDAFVTTEGRGDNKVEYIDHARYVTTSARIAEEIPSLLAKLEEGFGIIDITGNEVIEEGGVSSLRDWHRGREAKET